MQYKVFPLVEEDYAPYRAQSDDVHDLLLVLVPLLRASYGRMGLYPARAHAAPYGRAGPRTGAWGLVRARGAPYGRLRDRRCALGDRRCALVGRRCTLWAAASRYGAAAAREWAAAVR